MKLSWRRSTLRPRSFKPIDIKINPLPLGQFSANVKEFGRSLDSASARIIAFTSLTASIYGIGRAFKALAESSIESEAKFKQLSTLLNTTTAQFDQFKGSIFDVGRNTATSFQQVSDAALELSRQGLKASEVIKRTNDALVLSRLSGLSAKESIDALTGALNIFNKEALDSTQIINKLAAVGSQFAVSQKDLAESISRAGATAAESGVGFDKLLALIASLKQTTGRDGSIIANGLRSIFSRIERTASLEVLEQFNVQTRDLQGNVLAADKVLQNLANTYKNLSVQERQQLTTSVAGIQQSNQLKGLLTDLARANSTYSQALNVSKNATDEAINRNKLLNDTLQATLERTKTNATEFASIAGKLVFKPIITEGLEPLNAIFGSLKQTDEQSKGVGQKIGEGILKGIGKSLAGTGLVVGGAIAFNLLKKVGGFALEAGRDLTGINQSGRQQANIQGVINQLLNDGNSLYRKRYIEAVSLAEQEKAVLGYMEAQIVAQSQLAATGNVVAKSLVARGGWSVTQG